MTVFQPEQIMTLEMRDFFGRYFSTGHPMVDIILGFLVLRVLSDASASASQPFMLLGSFLESLKDWLFGWWAPHHKGQLEFGVEDEKTGCTNRFLDLSPAYKGLLHRLAQIQDERVWKLRYIFMEYYDNVLERNIDESVYEVLQDEPIEVEPHIFVQCDESEEDRPNNSGGEVRVLLRRVVLYSDTFSAQHLKKVVESWTEEYKLFKKTQLQGRQLIFLVRFNGKDEEETITYTEFHSYRSFDNLHFERKDAVLKEINFFLSNKEWYADRGLPDSLGILGYGEPGCGKTSFIKSLLKYTKRHAVVFSINQYTNLEAIERIMRQETICDFPIPQDQRVYILEDIDAMGDIVHKREGADDDSGKAPDLSPADVNLDPARIGPKSPLEEVASRALVGGMKKEKKKDGDDEDSEQQELLKLLVHGLGKKTENHLGFLLNLLDGVIESPGRIVVMTTNHVDKLDPALIRPGRVDLKLEFRRCTRDVLHQILSHFYDREPTSWTLPEWIPDFLFTPARAAQLCRGYKRDFEKMMEAMKDEVEADKAAQESGVPTPVDLRSREEDGRDGRFLRGEAEDDDDGISHLDTKVVIGDEEGEVEEEEKKKEEKTEAKEEEQEREEDEKKEDENKEEEEEEEEKEEEN